MKRLLIVGCGDVAQRALPRLLTRYRVYALVRRPEAAAGLRQQGVTPIIGDLDRLRSLSRIGGLADAVLHAAPPPAAGMDDARTRHLIAALGRRSLPRTLVYISTSGVYGDCGGERVCETRPPRPQTLRGRRRLAAEKRLRELAVRGVAVSLLRAPGIYAAERLSLDRLKRADPVLHAAEDVHTNHIHADDLARAVEAALQRGCGGRAYNLCDDTNLKMGDYYDLLADTFALARPPRATRAECSERLSAVTLSFMSESRQLDNTRAKQELGLRLRYPTVQDGLAAAARLSSQDA